MKPFQGTEPKEILSHLRRQRIDEHVESIFFSAIVPHARSFTLEEHWRRFKLIVACPEVYQRLGITTLPSQSPESLHRTVGWEVVGALANLLLRSKAVDDGKTALELSRSYLDIATNGQVTSVEGYACCDPWCDWFTDELGANQTCLVGFHNDWWLIVVNDPYC